MVVTSPHTPRMNVVDGHGTRGTEQGIFAFRFGDSEPTLIEEGRLLGISDSHVYFQALDGVCVQAY
jgi:hypothetical protein